MNYGMWKSGTKGELELFLNCFYPPLYTIDKKGGGGSGEGGVRKYCSRLVLESIEAATGDCSDLLLFKMLLPLYSIPYEGAISKAVVQ